MSPAAATGNPPGRAANPARGRTQAPPAGWEDPFRIGVGEPPGEDRRRDDQQAEGLVAAEGATLLVASLVLGNLPALADIQSMTNLLEQHGVSLTPCPDAAMRPHVLELTARHLTSTTAPYDLVRKMRASFLVLGPLVARCGEARVSLPGGCGIGAVATRSGASSPEMVSQARPPAS